MLVTRILMVFSLLLATAIFPASYLQAQESERQIRSLASILDEIQSVWSETLTALKSNKESEVAQKVDRLINLRDQAGLVALDDYSLELINQGEFNYKKGNRQTAIFYLSLADQMSPESPRVLFHSLKLVQVTDGLGSVLGRLSRSIISAVAYPEFLLQILKASIYPLLWAVTFGLYFGFVFMFLYQLPDIIRTIAHKLPGRIRGIVSPILTIVLFLTPCLFGPIVCLSIWTILTLMLLPERKWMSLLVGGTICLWGVCIPFRERVGDWLSNPGIQTMLRVTSGAYGRNDLVDLEKLANERPDDGAAWYTYAQVLKRSGNFAESQAAFLKAEELLGRQAWTLAERGGISFLLGNSRDADELMEKAGDRGLSSAGFLFNYSKVKFDLMDTVESRDLLKEARVGDARLVDRLQLMEESEGLHSQRALADIDLPVRVLLKAALSSNNTSSNSEQLAVASALAPMMTSGRLIALGALLIVLAFIVRGKGARKFSSYYHSYKPSFVLISMMTIIPGALWIRSGQIGMTVMTFCLSLIMLLPLIGWPPEAATIVDFVPGFYALYGSFAAVILLLVAYVASQTSEVS